MYNKMYILAFLIMASFTLVALIFLVKEEKAIEFLRGPSVNTFS